MKSSATMRAGLAVLLLGIAAGVIAAEVQVVGNVAVVNGDARMLLFDRPFDLEGRTIRFTPEGTGYRVENISLRWIDDTGPLAESFVSIEQARRVALSRFAFPFAGSTRTELFFDGVGAIRFVAPRITATPQLYDVHLAGIDDPLLSPLLRSGRLAPRLSLLFREEDSFAVATWIEGPAQALTYEVQARLGADGTIEFSYRRAPSITNGAVVVTPGATAWRSSREQLAMIADPPDDLAPAAPADLQSMVDLRAVSVARLAASDIVEIQIRVAGAIDQQRLGDRRLRYSIAIGETGLNTGIHTFVTAGALEYRPGNWTRVPLASTALTLDGDMLTVRVSDEMVLWRDDGNEITVTAGLEEWTPLDTASSPIIPGHVAAPAAMDLSAGGISTSGLIFETFTRPYLEPYTVWDAVREKLGLRDEDVDAVAIYSDLIIDLHMLGLAYSTVGNPGADGVMLRAEDHDPVGSAAPVRPALMLLGDAGPDISLLMHELGHRWLLNVQIDRGGGASLVLNEAFHPKPVVHMPAAFPSRAGEASCMGGSTFVETATGVFAASRPATCGFSWLELYLMGLAAPEEVAPWFYLTNPDREIPAGPFGTIEVRATKEIVTIDDLIRGMGPRNPASALVRRTFRVVFVVVGSEAEPATDARVAELEALRGPFAAEFSRVTGARGAILSTLSGRRRAVAR